MKFKKYRKIYHKNKHVTNFSEEGGFRDCTIELQERVNLFFWKAIKTELIFIKEFSKGERLRPLSDAEKLRNYLNEDNGRQR